MILYRGSDEPWYERGLTALDVFEYERDELGNENALLVSPEYLATVPANHCIWLCETSEDADYYGQAWEYEVTDPIYLFADDQGGYFVQHTT